MSGPERSAGDGGALSEAALAAARGTRWLGAALRVVGETTSTNDDASSWARAGAPHGAVVVAEAQRQGRGRQGRPWFSPPGDNLYLSAVLRPALPPSAAPPLTLAVGVGVCEAARALGVHATLKWPNDVVVGRRKVAGILTEMSSRGAQIEQVVFGVGLNVNTLVFPDDLTDVATSLRAARGGAPLDRVEVAAVLLARLEASLDEFLAGGPARTVEAWRARTEMLGTRVRVDVEGQAISGVAEDVDGEGALWLAADDGRRLRVLSGMVTS